MKDKIYAIFRFWTWNLVRANADIARSLALQMKNILNNVDGVECEVLAQQATGFNKFIQGEFEGAQQSLDICIEKCSPQDSGLYIEKSGQDSYVHCRAYAAMNYWFLGFHDKAIALCEEAISSANNSKNPFSLAIALTISLRVYQYSDRIDEILKYGEQSKKICEENNITHYLAMTQVLLGWAISKSGNSEKGLSLISDGIENVRRTGAQLYSSYITALKAEAYLFSGNYDLALNEANQSLHQLKETNFEMFYKSHILLLIARIQSRSGRLKVEGIKKYLMDGLKVAKQQKSPVMIATITSELELLDSGESL